MTAKNDVLVGTAIANHSMDDAIAMYEQALKKDPFYAPAFWSKCFLKLAQGDLSYWANYEWFNNPIYNSNNIGWFKRKLEKSVWDGKPLNNKKIFLYCDEGFGDFFQFVRYVELIKKMGGITILECLPDTFDLCKTIPGVDIITESNQKISHDVHCPLMLAPKFFGIESGYIPSQFPYLNYKPTNRINIDLMFEEQNDSLNIGVVWQGNPNHKEDKKRSVDYTLFKKLAEKGNLYSLQKNTFADGMMNLGVMLCDWVDTANAIAHMDLVISVDTAVAHLAGAMGKEVWLLTPKFPDWRWGLNDSKTPWYPSLRLFRQTEEHDWSNVINEIYNCL